MAPPDSASKLTPDEAKRKIALYLREGRVKPSLHCRRDSMPRRNVYLPDIVNVLTTGEIIREAEWDEDYDNWKYTVEGVDEEGEELRAVTVFFDADLVLLIVTVF